MARKYCRTKGCMKWKNISTEGYCQVCKPTNDLATDTDAKDPSICVVCTAEVIDGNPAVGCDACSRWYHADCAGPPELHKLLQYYSGVTTNTGNEGNEIDPSKVIGDLKWFCKECNSENEKCLNKATVSDTYVTSNNEEEPNFEKTDSRSNSISVEKQNLSSETDEHAIKKVKMATDTFSGIEIIKRIPTCEDYRHGKCVHGLSGKKIVNNQCCEFRHPKKCRYYCRYGSDPELGCNMVSCRFFHPIICDFSVRYGHCKKEGCTYVHLVGTNRSKTPDYSDYTTKHENIKDFAYGSQNKFYKKYPRDGSYENHNHNAVGRRPSNHYNSWKFDNVERQKHFKLNTDDYPPLDNGQTNNISDDTWYKHSKSQKNETNQHQYTYSSSVNTGNVQKQVDQHFLEVLEAIKTIQKTQESFHLEMHSLKQLIPAYQQIQFQPPNRSYQHLATGTTMPLAVNSQPA